MKYIKKYNESKNTYYYEIPTVKEYWDFLGPREDSYVEVSDDYKFNKKEMKVIDNAFSTSTKIKFQLCQSDKLAEVSCDGIYIYIDKLPDAWYSFFIQSYPQAEDTFYKADQFDGFCFLLNKIADELSKINYNKSRFNEIEL